MKILLNQNEIFLLKKTTLSEVLECYYPAKNNFSVAVNQRFIPRGQYTEIFLNDKDMIDIISPMQGG
jgi:thiamine biosynthesis protein ThiS